MSWFRIGGVSGSQSGLDGFPVPAAEIFYLVYSTPNNREFITHHYDPATNTFTVIDESHVQLTVQPNLFEIRIDGLVALQISNGIFRVNRISEKGFFAATKVHFYRRKKSSPDRLATLTKNGLMAVPRVRMAHRLPYKNNQAYRNAWFYRGIESLTWPANGFRFLNNGAYCAMIGRDGLQVVDFRESFEAE